MPKLGFLFLFALFLSISYSSSDSHFEGFEAEDDDFDEQQPSSLSSQPKFTTKLSTKPIPEPEPEPQQQPPIPNTFTDLWDEDEFEGLPLQQQQQQHSQSQDSSSNPNSVNDPNSANDSSHSLDPQRLNRSRSFTVEIVCGIFLIMFAFNYFSGKKENESIALSWAAQFAAKDSIFEKNFSLLGIGDGGDDSPLLLKEGQTTFKFYASGRRYCQGLLATLELKSRHDLIARIYNLIVPTRDEISFEVYMNDDAMDHVVFALAKKKAAKAMQKEERDLQRFGTLLSPPNGKKWVYDDLAVISESKEVAGDLLTEAVIDQVFGDKNYDKVGKSLISLHFSDQHSGMHRKVLLFKFVLPAAKNMADMTRLVALVPYYIDLIGRYKLSSQARSKTESARQKAAQEAQRELRNVQQEAIQRKKAEKKKLLEEAEAKLSAETIRKKEAKERARQMKKSMPRMKMTRGA
ncbi:unnamed protein product [Lupinus luteus]|uniref:Coiled-coil domain-containing protein 47 n=1 Tax=Lupinus luteus TaxID=3873 RepID=A0AAV1WKL8_LUPLU